MADWNAKSQVRECPECDGNGWRDEWRGVYGTVFCEGGAEVRCDECNGLGQIDCPVCGFGQIVGGVDCMVCDTIALLTPEELAEFDRAMFTRAFNYALGLAKGDVK